MKKRVFLTPIIQVSQINFDNCITNSSVRELSVDQQNINIEIMDWQTGDGFDVTDVTEYN